MMRGVAPSMPVVARRHFIRRRAITEAVWLLSTFVRQSKFDDVPMDDEVQSIFLVEGSKELLRERLLSRDGEAGLPEGQPSRIEAFFEHGQLIAKSANSAGLPVLQSRPFATLLQRAMAVLESGS